MLGILNYLFGNQQALQMQRNIEDKVSKLTADALIQSNDQKIKLEIARTSANATKHAAETRALATYSAAMVRAKTTAAMGLFGFLVTLWVIKPTIEENQTLSLESVKAESARHRDRNIINRLIAEFTIPQDKFETIQDEEYKKYQEFTDMYEKTASKNANILTKLLIR